MSSGILASATLIGPFGFGPVSGAGTHQGSRGSRWLITSSARRTSPTWRASGPCADIRCASIGRSAGALPLKAGMRPCVGLMVATPLQCAGQRSEPPMSLPCAMVPMPAATAEARAARGAAAGDVRVPGIERQSVQRIVGEAAEREFRRVGKADDDRAGLLQVTHHGRIRRRDEVLVGGNAVEIGPAFVVDVLLDGDGHAVQQPEFAALGALLVGRMRGLQRVLAEIDDDRVQPGIDRMHPLQMRLDGLHRGDGAGADRSRGLHCRPLPGRPLGAASAADLRGGLAFLDRLLCRLRGGPLADRRPSCSRSSLFLRSAFLLVAVFFATPHLLKLRGGGYGRHEACTGAFLHGAWRDTRCDGL